MSARCPLCGGPNRCELAKPPAARHDPCWCVARSFPAELLKAVDYQDVEAASGGRSRQRINLKAGISSDMAKRINTRIKEMKLKGIQSSTQGDQVRVTGKKRDALQDVIAALKEADLDLPLQFNNFRD